MSSGHGSRFHDGLLGLGTSLHDFERIKQQVRDRVDLVELVTEHVRLRRVGSRWVGLCPFHSEKTPSFSVNPDMGLFKCFGCGKGGDLFTFVQERERMSFVEALRYLADRCGVEWEVHGGEGRENQGPSRQDLARVNDWACRWFRARLEDAEQGADVRTYVENRGIASDVSERFGLGLAPEGNDHLLNAARRAGIAEALLIAADLVRKSERGSLYDTFRNRLMFPIRDASSRVVGFGGRTLGDDRAKYLNTRQTSLFDKGRGLYGMDLARRAAEEAGSLVLVEGYTDCIAVHQAGFGHVAATLGTALTGEQIELIRRYCDQVILLFDADQAGEAAADRAIRIALPRYVTVRLARVPDGKDPAEFLAEHSPEAFGAALERAIDALEFKWSRLRDRFGGAATPGQQRAAVEEFLAVVVEACGTGALDAIQRGLLVNQMGHVLKIPGTEVHRLMTQQERRRARSGSGTAVAGEAAGAGPSGASSRGAVLPNSRTIAWIRVIEVLLNRPDLLAQIEGGLDVGGIRDEQLCRLAGYIWQAGAQVGSFALSDVLALCSDSADTAKLVELAESGAARGNYEPTLTAALEIIRRSDSDRELRRRMDALSTGTEDTEASGEQDLRAIHQRLSKHRHFAPRSLIRQSTDDGPAGEG
jgi:DNA primase catalytic core